MYAVWWYQLCRRVLCIFSWYLVNFQALIDKVTSGFVVDDVIDSVICLVVKVGFYVQTVIYFGYVIFVFFICLGFI